MAVAMKARLIVVGLLLLFFGRLLHAETQTGSTFDEVYYLLQSSLYWRDESLVPVTQHPPLTNAIIGIPDRKSVV